jgi:HK97 family phage prohead protease
MPVAPIKAQDNAKRGLELRREWSRGGTAVGVARARDLSNGADLSIETIKRMAQFNRHRQNYQPDKKESDGGPTAGTIAWLLWGGTEGVDWAIKISNQTMKKEIKSFPFEIKEFKEQENNIFTVEGYASIFDNIDLGNDKIIKGAFTDSIKKRMPKLLWGHNQKDVPIGKITEIKEDNNGLFITAELPIEDDFVRGRIIPQIKIGSLDSFSIGYTTEKADFDKKTGARLLQKINLFEISLVSIPMNPSAIMTAYKSIGGDLELPLADREYEWDSASAIQRIRDFTNSTEEPSDTYENYFLYYEDENEDAFTAYKLPFVDIIDNQAYIVPRAIFAIAAALQGARGGLNIPATEKEAISNIVNNLYDRMAKEFNDDTIISPLKKEKAENLENINDIRGMENFLKTKFSNENSKLIISKIKEINQRDVEIKNQRDAEKKLMVEIIANLNSMIK